MNTKLKIIVGLLALVVALLWIFGSAIERDREYRQSELYRRAKQLEVASHEPGWIGKPLTFKEAEIRAKFLMERERELTQ